MNHYNYEKIYILVIVSAFLNQIYGQEIPFKIQKSEILYDKYKKSGIVLSENDENGNLLIVRSYNGNGITENQGFYIEKYNQNLKLIKEFEFEMKHPRTQKYNIVLGVFYAEKSVQIVEIYYDLNRKTHICQANTIDENFIVSKKELFSLTKDENKTFDLSLEQRFYNASDRILNIDNSGNFGSERNFDSIFSYKSDNIKIRNGSDIIFIINDSKTAFAVALESKQKNGELKLYLFDNKLNKKIDTSFFKQKEEKKYLFQNIQVSNKGDAIYLLAKSFTDDVNKKKEGGKYIFEITKINVEIQKSQNIDIKEYFIGSLKMFFHNDDIICLGFNSDLSDNKYKGISYFKLDSNSLEVINTKHNAFTEQFIVDKYGNSKQKSLKHLNFKKVFFTSSNNLILNAQEEYIIESGYGVNGIGYGGIGYGGGSRTIYYYDDIVSLKLSEDGDLIWARNINKNQYTSDQNCYISYSSLVKDNENFFFINSGEKPKKISNDRIEFTDIRKNKSNLNLIRIRENGDFDYQEILDDKENQVPFMVSKGIIIKNTIYFLGSKGREKQLLEITL